MSRHKLESLVRSHKVFMSQKKYENNFNEIKMQKNQHFLKNNHKMED